jgi:hypothetical protein
MPATKIAGRELWRNVSPGLRYYITMDALGNQTHGVVQPGRTFTITPLERQLNQQAAHSGKADLFRNGTFVLVQETDDTILDEIKSPNSLADDDIEKAVSEAIAGDPVPFEAMLERMSSAVTGQRILEEVVLQDASQSMVNAVKGKIQQIEDAERPVGPDGQPMRVVEREQIPAPEATPAEAFRQERAVRPR